MINLFKRALNCGQINTLLEVSAWDAHAKIYTYQEIAARFLRIKGYRVQITISDNTDRPSFMYSYIRFYRYAKIQFNY